MSTSNRLLPFSPSNRASRANTASSSRLPTPDPSPAVSRRRTHSEANDDSENAPPPATVIPGRKRRKKDGVANQMDREVWGLTDVEICDASKATWKSDAYDHYNITLRRDEVQKILYFRFLCKFGHESHSAIERRREKSSNGTSNLLRTAQTCDEERGIVVTSSAAAQHSYSAAAHRAIIVMRTATSNRPFNFVNDKYYKMEVELLRPGTIIPSASTVSRDLKLLYLELSKGVKSYFVKRDRPIHAVIDGWTAPLGTNFL
ncbi:hypothetical protein C8R47DRAFT_1037153, partial [Mycena vitilis]